MTALKKYSEMTREELLKKAGNGIYVTAMKGFHAGAKSFFLKKKLFSKDIPKKNLSA